MTKRTVFITFLSAITLVVVVGLLSFYVSKNQPTADVATPPTPPPPSTAPKNPPTPSLRADLKTQNPPTPGHPDYLYPPVPKAPLISGDATDDGIVDVLDINVLLVHWNEVNEDYSMVDEGSTKVIDTLDLSQAIKYWRCLETRTGKDCPYRT